MLPKVHQINDIPLANRMAEAERPFREPGTLTTSPDSLNQNINDRLANQASDQVLADYIDNHAFPIRLSSERFVSSCANPDIVWNFFTKTVARNPDIPLRLIFGGNGMEGDLKQTVSWLDDNNINSMAARAIRKIYQKKLDNL
ncbi:MAG TPA: hypothetical protein VMR08_00040 [Patescibacteria group bacterium]|jgi:hypothetical protein|nr:hypothetical protein [Patescibacteria group bacterium]